MLERLKNPRTWATAAGVLAAVGLLAWAFAPRPLEVETAVVGRGRFEQGIEEDGRTRVKDRFTVSSPVAARVARIALREGDPVSAGQPLAVLTPVMSSMVDERSTREAAARLKAAAAGVTLASARTERARIALEEARLELQRSERLAGEGYVSAARLASARLAVDGARRELEAAGAQQAVAVQERAQAAAVLQPAQGVTAGQPLLVRSPVAGVVLRVPLQSEATVAPGTPLLEVGDASRLEVLAQLLTTDAVAAKPGTRAVIERWGGPAVEGVVRRVEPSAFTKVSALGIEEQRVNVILDVTDAPPAWRAIGDGFRVTVRVVTASAADAVLVPVGALVPNAEGGMGVYRLDGNRARLVPIELAGRNGSHGWVRAGLAAGEAVIVYPPSALVDGRRVAVRGR